MSQAQAFHLLRTMPAPSVEQTTIEVDVETLQDWSLCLSQSDTSPRWEIDRLLEQHGLPNRSRD